MRVLIQHQAVQNGMAGEMTSQKCLYLGLSQQRKRLLKKERLKKACFLSPECPVCGCLSLRNDTVLSVSNADKAVGNSVCILQRPSLEVASESSVQKSNENDFNKTAKINQRLTTIRFRVVRFSENAAAKLSVLPLAPGFCIVRPHWYQTRIASNRTQRVNS